jgi:predicted transposase YbfD/YdcC
MEHTLYESRRKASGESESGSGHKQLRHVVRRHWAIEDELSWVLDVALTTQNECSKLCLILYLL